MELISQMVQKVVNVVYPAALARCFGINRRGSVSADFLYFVAVSIGFDVVGVVIFLIRLSLHFESLEGIFFAFGFCKGFGVTSAAENGLASVRRLL